MDRLGHIIQFIDDRKDQPLVMEEIAKAAYLSPISLYRAFKQKTGLTPIQYHEAIRIKESLRLLQEKSSVADVAFDLGYENYETFSRAFKRICEISPSDVLWAMSFLDHQYIQENYVLVKQKATIQEVQQLLLETPDLHHDSAGFKVFRIQSRSKNRPEIKRCLYAESILQRGLV